MGREATITYQQVADAAEALQASGRHPNARNIRDRLGTGSMGTIQRFLQTWRDTQPVPEPAPAGDEPAPATPPDPVPAPTEGSAERHALETQLAEAQAQLSQLRDLADRQRQELAAMKTHLDGALAARAFAEAQVREVQTRLDEALANVSGQVVSQPSPDHPVFLPLPGMDANRRFLDTI